MSDPDAQTAALQEELAALRKREQDLTDFVENASLALHWVGADGRILWANQAELDLLGYTREEYIGRYISEFHADAAAIEDILHRLSRRETLRNYEARLRCKDGTIRHVLISSNVRWNEDKLLHTRCFTRDITERKHYEQSLLTQNAVGKVLGGATSLQAAAPAILQAIATHMDWRVGLLWTTDDDHQALRCAAYSETGSGKGGAFASLCREITFPRGVGIPGRVWSRNAPAWVADLHSDDNIPRLRLAVEHGLRSAFAFPITLDGQVHGVMEFFAEEIRPADDELLQTAAALGYQISEFVKRTRAQQQLTEREESYRVLTETASDGIVTINSKSTILFANTAAAKTFGYAIEELIGSKLTVLMPEHLRTIYEAAIAEYLRTGQRHAAWQAMGVSGVHRDGYEIPVEISFNEYKQEKKHFFVGIIRDIRERKRLDEALQQSSKLESLGVLAGGIAHDFNNLLTGIIGNISLALEAASEKSPARANLRDALEAGERAAHLTQQLLAYAGKGRFFIAPVNVSALVREISGLIRSSIPKHVTLRLDLQDPLPQVDADVAQLQQLIMNLVINGAEAIPERREGTVLVITRAQEVDAQYLATLGTAEIGPGHYVIINVHDNGVGMDEATLNKIFDPFFTTKFTGRGLGLAATSGIVRGHKGALKVFSNPGQGTTFKVLLPVGSAAVRERPAQPGVRANLSGRGMVLVVDDEPVVRKIAATSLRTYGYTVVTAENGREGVERFRELHSSLRMVLLDVTMPVMNGEEALELMRSINPQVPVILSSGYNEADAIRRFAGKGLAGFLQKPYSAAALAGKLKTILQPQGIEDFVPG